MHDAMVLATVREDGFPQATTMTYVHDGLSIYFGCDSKTQKARNLVRNPKVSGAIGESASDWTTLQGLSFGGVASRVTNPNELDRVVTLNLAKYPQIAKHVPDDFDDPVFFRIDVIAFSILDYRQRFGHHRLVVCSAPERGAVAAGARLAS
jgi:general stress protein 26